MNKWQEWHDSLSPSMQKYLKQQAVWHDQDLFKYSAVAFLIGLAIGICL